MAIKRSRFQKGVELIPEDLSAEDLTREGEVAYDSDSDKLKYRNASATKEVLNTDEAQTLENKTIDATAASGNNTVTIDASSAAFDNAASGMVATNAQAALDELDGRVDSAETNLSDHLSDAVDAHDASAISNVPSGNLAATDIQGAVDELQSDIDTRALDSDLTDHINDAVDAHDASAISNVPSGNLAATDVQAALDELQTDIDTRALDSALTDHINDTTDAHTASAVTNVPSGNLAATDVQGALDELQTDVDSRLPSGDLTTHEADTSTHGVTEIVGTSEAQILTNKDIDGGTASNTTRLTLPKETKANLDSLTRKEATLVYATDQSKAFIDNGTDLIPVGSGEGTGDYNYIENNNAELNLDGWVRYGNTTPLDRPDDFGGLVFLSSLEFNRNTTNPLIGDADFELAKLVGANAFGQGVYYQFTAENAHLTVKNLLRMSANTDLFDDGDASIWLVGSNDSFVSDFNLISANNPDVIAGSPQIFKQFQFDANSTEYRLCIHWSNPDTAAKTMYFDNVVFGPSEVATGAVVYDTQSYTPTITGFGTPTNVEFSYRRVGDSLEVNGKFISGTSTAVEAQISLPDNLTIKSGLSIQKVGDSPFNVSTASYLTILATGGDSFFNVGKQSGTTAGLTAANGDTLVASGQAMSFKATVQIEGWSSTAVSSEDLGHREVTVLGRGNSASTLTANTERVDWILEEDNTSSMSQVDNGLDTFTAPESGLYNFTGVIRINSANNGNIKLYKNNVSYQQLGEQNVTNLVKPFSTTLRLVKGDTIDFRLSVGSTLQNDGPTHILSITKIANSQTILETDLVAARYTSNSGQVVAGEAAIIYEDKDYDTHDAYNASTGEYTVPVTGYYNVKGSFRPNASATINIKIMVDSVDISEETIAGAQNTVSVSDKLYLTKGQIVEIGNGSGSSRTLDTTARFNNFSISRIK